jgi:pimeloyl-ACP methyl ester carboxylesterase
VTTYRVKNENKTGHLLAVSEWGKRDGMPVFLLHGTPGSRLGVVPRPSVLYQLGIRLIAYDRPGYSDSERVVGRTIASAASDVKAIADYLGIDDFAVAGRSGGAPHALACAALLPGRVTRAAALVSLAPKVGPDGMGPRWTEGMTQGNVDVYAHAARGIDALASGLNARSRTIRADPDAMISQLRSEVHPSDLEVISDAGIRGMPRTNYQEALRVTGDGWIDDAMAFIADWGFRLDQIDVPVLLWHGEDDVFSPVEHSVWLHSHIPGSELRLEPGKAHFNAMTVLPELLPWLRQPRPAADGRSAESVEAPAPLTRSAVRAHG